MSFPFITTTSTGNVGINTTVPTYRLQVSQDNTGAYPGDTTAGQFVISGATDSTKRFGFQLDTTRNFGHIQVVKLGTTAYPLILNGIGGNVGIATTSPNAQLSVNNDFHIMASNASWNSTATKGLFMRYSTNGGQDGAYIQSVDRSTFTWQSLSIQAKSLSLTTSGGEGFERITIASTGNVGINTTTPSTSLHVNGTIRGNAVEMNGGGGAMQIASGTGSSGSGSGTVSFPFTFTNAPKVVGNVISSSTTQLFSLHISNVTTTGFTYTKTYILTSGGSGPAYESFYWMAMG